MITEDYVSFEVARLLREKGFKGYVHAWHNIYDKINLDFRIAIDAPHLQIPAPTLQMAMKWLREKYYIYADPIKQGNYNDCSEYYTWIVARIGIIHRNPSVDDKLSYEEAAEAALKYSLENLI